MRLHASGCQWGACIQTVIQTGTTPLEGSVGDGWPTPVPSEVSPRRRPNHVIGTGYYVSVSVCGGPRVVHVYTW